jgi:hypothetical protein
MRVCEREDIGTDQRDEPYALPNFSELIDQSTPLKTVDLEMVVVAHWVRLELHEYDNFCGLPTRDWWGNEHVRKRVNESTGVWLKRFIEHHRELRKILLHRFEVTVLDALAAEYPEFRWRRNGALFDGRDESLPGHRVFRRDDQISGSLLGVGKKPAEPSSSEIAIPIPNAGGTGLYLTVRLHQEHGVVAFVRDQSIQHRRAKVCGSEYFGNRSDLHAIIHP